MGAGFVRIVTDSSFDRDVLGSDKAVLVAFSAPWCGPCRLLKPGLRALAARRRHDLTVGALDVDANPASAKRYQVDRFPTCILFKSGEPVERLDGYMPLRKIESTLLPHLERD